MCLDSYYFRSQDYPKLMTLDFSRVESILVENICLINSTRLVSTGNFALLKANVASIMVLPFWRVRFTEKERAIKLGLT